MDLEWSDKKAKMKIKYEVVWPNGETLTGQTSAGFGTHTDVVHAVRDATGVSLCSMMLAEGRHHTGRELWCAVAQSGNYSANVLVAITEEDK